MGKKVLLFWQNDNTTLRLIVSQLPCSKDQNQCAFLKNLYADFSHWGKIVHCPAKINFSFRVLAHCAAMQKQKFHKKAQSLKKIVITINLIIIILHKMMQV